jgi:hypothetical protein
MVKQCLFCGRYFTPDYRLKERQKACAHPVCRKAREKAAQRAWIVKNPGYFAHLYETYVKPWRERRRMIKDAIPPAKPYIELILRIPDKKKRMIKDEIRLQRVGKRTFAADGYG